MQAGYRDDVHEPGTAHRDIEGVIRVKILFVSKHQGFDKGTAVSGKNVVHAPAQKMTQPGRKTRNGKASLFKHFAATGAQAQIIPVRVIIVIGLAVKGIRRSDFCRKRDAVTGLRRREGFLIVVDNCLEARQIPGAYSDIQSVIAPVQIRVIQNRPPNLPRFARIFSRTPDGQTIIYGVFHQPEGEEQQRDHGRTQPFSSRQRQKSAEHGRQHRRYNQPALGQNIVCKENCGGKSQRRRRELSHIPLRRSGAGNAAGPAVFQQNQITFSPSSTPPSR